MVVGSIGYNICIYDIKNKTMKATALGICYVKKFAYDILYNFWDINYDWHSLGKWNRKNEQ